MTLFLSACLCLGVIFAAVGIKEERPLPLVAAVLLLITYTLVVSGSLTAG